MKSNLSGVEIVGCLRKGHMVRRSCWVDDYYIRICNEGGFDEDGNAITEGRWHTAIYTHATSGYFLHLAYSGQPFREPRVFGHKGQLRIASRDGEGVAMLFDDDWEDHGFISGDDFDALTKATKETVRGNIAKSHDEAIAKREKAEDLTD